MSAKVYVANDMNGLSNPPGLTNNLSELTETSEEALKRILLPGETITCQFDCYFPGGMLPMWKIIYLCIITLGLYGFVLFYRSYLRMCYRMKCITPPLIEFSRGKLGITNKGRLICWKETVMQKKLKESNGGILFCLCNCLVSMVKCCFRDTCGAPVEYRVQTTTRVYNASSIRQVTQYYRSKANCLFWCVEYECGVEVSIGQFNFSSADVSATAASSPASSYYATLSALISSSITSIEGLAGASQSNLLNVTSDTFDRGHNGDIHLVLEELAGLHSEIIAALPATPDSFMSNADIEFGKQGSMQKVNGFLGITIVHDDRTIEVPSKWFPMLPGEEILATNGEVYQMSTFKWFLSIITLGYYYCKYISPMKYDRSALVLTNKRVVDMDIYQRAGTVPTHLANFSVKVRSYFPGDVVSGYVSSLNKLNLTASILCEGGQLLITFPSGRAALPFARALQMSTARARSHVDIQRTQDSTSHLTPADMLVLPLFSGEKIISSVDGDRTWLPFCSDKHTLGCVNWCRVKQCWCRPVANVCSPEACGCCFPWLPFLFTCALRPFQNNDDLIVTPSTLLRYTRAGNFGLCYYNDYCMTRDYFLVSWAPLEDLIGQNLTVTSAGNERFRTRCCRNNLLGRVCCPIGKATFELDLDLKKVAFGVRGEAVNHNWNTDPKVQRLTTMVSTLQVAIEQKKRMIGGELMDRGEGAGRGVVTVEGAAVGKWEDGGDKQFMK